LNIDNKIFPLPMWLYIGKPQVHWRNFKKKITFKILHQQRTIHCQPNYQISVKSGHANNSSNGFVGSPQNVNCSVLSNRTDM